MNVLTLIILRLDESNNSGSTSATHHQGKYIKLYVCNVLDKLCLSRLADFLENHTDWSLYFDRVTSCGVV